MIAQEVIEAVSQAVLEQGSLTKAQIEETWDIDEESYKELQRRVLATDTSIEKGPQRVGGFTTKKRGGKFPAEGEGDSLLLRSEWEKKTVARMSELLKHSELENMLGTLLQTLRRVRIEETGMDRRGTKLELATALVLQHGIDLFYDREIRRTVAKAVGIDAPDKWHPGKAAAIKFVLNAGFPDELAGIPTEDSLPDFEYLEGRFRLKTLWDFQTEVKEELDRTLKTPGERALVTLPTGAGKTRVAVESIRDSLSGQHNPTSDSAKTSTVLWLAHTEELCEQAYTCFKQVWETSESVCPLLLVRFWGRYTQDLAKHRETLRQILSKPSVLVSTPQRIINLLDERIDESTGMLQDLVKALGLLIVDEAHRAAAKSYKHIMEFLLPRERRVSVAGLTATPFRMEYLGDDREMGTRELKEIFHRLIEPLRTLGENPRAKLQELGVLARPVLKTIDMPTRMRIPDLPQSEAITEEDLERIDRVLAVRTDNSPRRLAILKELLPIAKNEDNSILYFGPTVRDAECMAFLLRRQGVPAAVVSGKTRDVTRRQVVTEFKQRKVRVLCNCEVLTTGFDAPLVTHIVMARPTVSRVLYEQIIGRGLRGSKFGGTDTCEILNCKDNFQGNPPSLGYESFRKIWDV